MESDTTKIAIIAALAVVTSSVTALNEFTKIFDFAPFWSDLLVALGTMSAAAYLLARARSERIVVARHSALRRIFGAATSYFLPVFIALLGVITIVHPIGNVVHGSWLACGVVETQCGQPRCIRLFDERERGKQPVNVFRSIAQITFRRHRFHVGTMSLRGCRYDAAQKNGRQSQSSVHC